MIPFHFRIWEAADFLQKRVKTTPRHAILLGTGLKDLPEDYDIKAQIPLHNIPHFPAMTVDHMDANLYVAVIDSAPVWILGGRLHYYEGYTMEQVTFPIRVLADAGTEFFFMTNAAGNVNPEFAAGELILFQDHINWSFPSPLIGENRPEWGERYPLMEDVYAPDVNQQLLKFARQRDIQLDTGVYLGLTGPQLETPAEYRLFRSLGADMVGMSTIPEVIVAAHMKRRITALSVLSNDASGNQVKHQPTVDSILETIHARKDDVAALINHWVSL